VALRYRLTGALARVEEVRGNAYDALVRADQMALTIGMAAGLFRDLGTFESGALDHSFCGPEVIPLAPTEQATADQLMADAADKKLMAGWSQAQVWREAGLDEATIQQMQAEKASQDVIPTVGQ
jgi:hypothetical protein